jgi:dolichyl-phosphate beta-glucosyltransferase
MPGQRERLAVRPDLSLVVAAYNGAGEIETSLASVREYLDKQPYPHEVIVVNDGSTDDTAAVLAAIARDYPQLRILHNRRNMGKGHSIRRGVLEAAGRFIVFTDADLAYPIEGVQAFLQPLWDGTHAVAVGSRVHPSSVYHLHPRHFRYVYRRHLMSRAFNWMVRTSLGIRVMDTQCGFKGFEGESAKAIFSRVRIPGFTFDVEVLLLAQCQGHAIIEIPVTCAYKGEVSTVKVMQTSWRAFVDLAKIYWWDRQGNYRRPGPG